MLCDTRTTITSSEKSVNFVQLITQLLNSKIILERISLSTYARKIQIKGNNAKIRAENPSQPLSLNSPPKLLCSKCNKYFRSLTEHRKYCGSTPSHACAFCPFKSFYKGNLKKHVQKTHTKTSNAVCRSAPISHICAFCPFKTFYKGSLNKHVQKIHTKTSNAVSRSAPITHTCALCPFKSIYKGNLKKHLQKTHTKTINAVSRSAPISHTCAICPFKTIYKGNLKNHVQKTHTKTSNAVSRSAPISHTCSICHFKTVSKENLNKHIENVHTTTNIAVIHNIVKSYCPNCDESRRNTNRLKICYKCKSDLLFRCEKCKNKYSMNKKVCKHVRFYIAAFSSICSKCDNEYFNGKHCGGFHWHLKSCGKQRQVGSNF